MAKLFIGMPVYNGERFIKKSIDSIINQTFRDWKLFISDDGSTDMTESICRSYVKTDPRIEYYKQEKNIGLFKNFKFTLDKADCPYFVWCAQDDIREKEYLEVCIGYLDTNKNTGMATTVMAAIDSFDRTLIEEWDALKLSGKTSILNVSRYILQPEILGKCNLMYGVFREEVARATWDAYPQRNVWGQDYMFSLALISRFEIFVHDKVLFKKRLGGYSSPNALQDDESENVRRIVYKNPKNHMFPFGRFEGYFNGHMEALRGTPYSILGALLLFIRLPRAFLIHVMERDVKKYIKRIISR
jgi:glycosyltransferase involved in cell wall biosynthesis